MKLTQRQQAILWLGICNQTQHAIAQTLGLHFQMVKRECRRIVIGMGVRNFHHACKRAVRHGDLLLPDEELHYSDVNYARTYPY